MKPGMTQCRAGTKDKDLFISLWSHMYMGPLINWLIHIVNLIKV